MIIMKKILILAGPEFEDIELLYPYYRLLEEGFEVDIVSHPDYGSLLTGKHGYTARVTKNPSEVDVKEYAALVLPGGRGPERIRVYKDIVDIVLGFALEDKLIAAICHGPQLLISASLREPKILRGRKVTSVPSIRDDLVAAGAIWVDAPVVVDDNLVTSRIPKDIPDWMREVIKRI